MPYTRRRVTYRRRRVAPRPRNAPRRVYRKTTTRRKAAVRQGRATRQIPFPPKYFTKLNYAEFGNTLVSTLGSLASSEWRLNSLYDPRVAVGGGQPRYFDSLCGADGGVAPYRKYVVTGCKAIVNFNSYSGAVGGTVAIGYRPASATAPTSMRECLERAGYKCREISYYAGGPSTRMISMYVPINRVFGISRVGLTDDLENYGAPYNNSPPELALFDVFFQPSVSSTSTISFTIKFVYYVRFSERNDVEDS